MNVQTKATDLEQDDDVAASRATETTSLRESAYKEIKHRIITCAFRPGVYLNEAWLSSTLGFGRTPVHQAVERLMHEGMVEVIPRKGVIVKPVSLDDVMQIIEVRMVSECFGVRLAAERASVDEIRHLSDILGRSEQWMTTRNSEQMMLLDREFHETLARAAKNDVLADMLGKLHDRSLRFWFLSLTAPGYHISVQEQHAAIFHAVEGRSPERAECAMKEHIESFRRNVARYI